MDQCGKAVIIHLGILLGLQTIIPMAKKTKPKTQQQQQQKKNKELFYIQTMKVWWINNPCG